MKNQSNNATSLKMNEKTLSLLIKDLGAIQNLSDQESSFISGGFCLGGADPSVDPHWCSNTIITLLDSFERSPLSPT